MAKKDYFLIIDTETTQNGNVADFGAVICDRNGEIYSEIAVMVQGVFGEEDLFWNGDAGHFGKSTLEARTDKYQQMVKSGSRSFASVNFINRWLESVNGKYNPILTAYNISFDVDKCANTMIDLSIFDKRFCLWGACVEKFAYTKKYKSFILENGYFGNRTKGGRIIYKTNAEVMSRFISNNPDLADEPHTAIEDVKFYELPLLVKLVKLQSKKKWLNPEGFNWRKLQAKDHFIAK